MVKVDLEPLVQRARVELLEFDCDALLHHPAVLGDEFAVLGGRKGLEERDVDEIAVARDEVLRVFVEEGETPVAIQQEDRVGGCLQHGAEAPALLPKLGQRGFHAPCLEECGVFKRGDKELKSCDLGA